MSNPYQQIAEKFNLQLQVQSYEELIVHVADHLRALMMQNPEKLFQMFYLLDVSEAKVKATIDAASGPHVYSDLAKLIIERELQRVKGRAQKE